MSLLENAGGMLGELGLPGADLFGGLLGSLGSLFDDGPKFTTQLVRAYESGKSPIDGARLALLSEGNAEEAERLRKEAGWNGGLRSPDETAKDCGAFSLWLAVTYGLANMGLPSELPSRCAEKQHKDELNQIYGGTTWRQQLHAVYEMLNARDPGALELVDQLQRPLGQAAVSIPEIRSFLEGAPQSSPTSSPPIYTGDVPSSPAPSPSSSPGPSGNPATMPAQSDLVKLAPLALLLLLLK